MRYVSRPQEVEAVQWLGGDPDPLSAVAPFKVRIGDGNALELLAGKDGAQGWVPVPLGHWIMRVAGDPSDVWPVDNAYFTRKYQPWVNPDDPVVPLTDGPLRDGEYIR